MKSYKKRIKNLGSDEIEKMVKDLEAMKPWFDDPLTHEQAHECMLTASMVGILRAAGEHESEAGAVELLKNQSKFLSIPYSVLDSYANGIAALQSSAIANRNKP